MILCSETQYAKQSWKDARKTLRTVIIESGKTAKKIGLIQKTLCRYVETAIIKLKMEANGFMNKDLRLKEYKNIVSVRSDLGCVRRGFDSLLLHE